MLQRNLPSALAMPRPRARPGAQDEGTFSGGTAASLKTTMAAAASQPGVMDLLKNPSRSRPGLKARANHQAISPWWTKPWAMGCGWHRS